MAFGWSKHTLGEPLHCGNAVARACSIEAFIISHGGGEPYRMGIPGTSWGQTLPGPSRNWGMAAHELRLRIPPVHYFYGDDLP